MISRRSELRASSSGDGERGQSGGGGRRRRERRQPRPPPRAGRLLIGVAPVHVRRRRVLQLHCLLLPGYNHGTGDPMELHARDGRHLLHIRGLPSPRAWRHDHRRRRRLGDVDTLASGRELQRRRHRRPPPAPGTPLLAEALREVPALRYDGVPVLVPDRCLVPLQLVVRRLPVIARRQGS